MMFVKFICTVNTSLEVIFIVLSQFQAVIVTFFSHKVLLLIIMVIWIINLVLDVLL